MARRNSLIRWLAASTVVILLSSCAGSDDSVTSSSTAGPSTTAASQGGDTATTATTSTTAADTAGSNSLDPCSLLTAADITDATGIDFGEAAVSENARSICDWTGLGDQYATVQTLVVESDVWQTQRDSAATAFEVVDLDIPGTDDAFSTADSIIGMRIGGIYVQVSYLVVGVDSPLDALIEMATTAAGNVPG